MTSILDLPDECLRMICKKLERDMQQYYWSNVCTRFQSIYFEYFHNWIEVDDNLAKNYGHIIGTGDFPLRVIKRLNLSKSKCTKDFLNKLRDCHKEIEEAKLFSFTDEYLAELLPLPNLKKLICIGTYNLRGSSLMELSSLTELRIHTNKLFDPENLLQITYYNPLRTLVMPNNPHMFSNRYAFEMFENLKNVEQLVIEFNPCKSWQLVGTLPKLKKLEIWDFVSHKCETCLENYDLYGKCTGQHATLFFDELRRRNQLEELVLSLSKVSEQHLLRISELTNLKRLLFWWTPLTTPLSLGVFKDLVNLEELHIGACAVENTMTALELIRCCKKLKVLHLWFAVDVTAHFLTEANDILSRRQPTPVEPLTIGFSQFAEIWQLIQFEKPLPFLRLVKLTKRFDDAEDDYFIREEDCMNQTNVQADSLKRKFSIMNMEVSEEEFQITIKMRELTTRQGA